MDQTQPRVYGAYHDDPDPGPQPGHTYRPLVGGPLDGLLIDVTRTTRDERADGAALITEYGAHGAGGRAWYAPDGDDGPWVWEGDSA